MSQREGRIESDTGVVCERCVVADSFRLRLRGLMGRKSLSGDEGLLLIGSPSIHTSFMKFPIDALFLNRELEVIAVKPGLRPWRISGRRKAKHILELRSGEAARRGVGAGARLRLIEPASAATPTLRAPRDEETSIRVLIGASDRRFLRVASFLLGRNGFAVARANRLAELMDAVERGSADVVVLDASGPERWPVRAAAALEDSRAGVAVLLVRDGADDPEVLPKWGSFDRLVEEIHRANARIDAAVVMPA